MILGIFQDVAERNAGKEKVLSALSTPEASSSQNRTQDPGSRALGFLYVGSHNLYVGFCGS